MRSVVVSLVVVALFVLAAAWYSHPAVALAQECTAVPSQENASVITVLPENDGTLTAATASVGIIQCE